MAFCRFKRKKIQYAFDYLYLLNSLFLYNRTSAKKGISKKDKEFLLDELDSMIETLEDWRENNPPLPKRKTS